jgi:hypothetical protein
MDVREAKPNEGVLRLQNIPRQVTTNGSDWPECNCFSVL